MKLIIAEKPDVCKQLKNAIEPSSQWMVVKKASKYAVGYYEGKKYIFAAAQGHLFELMSPGEINPQYERWSLNDLPLALPSKIPLKHNQADKAYFKTISQLIKRTDVDEIIVATDPDKEGQNIYEKVKLMIKGFPHTKKETRIWINEWTPEGLRDALDNRKLNSEYDGLRIAAECREESDAIIGWNDSRAGTLKYGGKGNVISLGRVQTPTNYFVYDLECKIQNFKPEPYSILSLEVASDEVGKTGVFKYVQKDGKLDKVQADAIYDIVSKLSSTKVAVASKKVSSNCLSLYNTVDAQKDMNKKYGMTAEETSNALQSLYLKGLTTYPRTEMKKISKANAKSAFNALISLEKSSVSNSFIKEAVSNKYNISSGCTTSDNLPHEAITPAFGSISESEIKALTKIEKQVYEAIIQRFVQAFFPTCVINETTVSAVLDINGEKESFEAKGKVVLVEGWTKVLGMDKSSYLPSYTDNSKYVIENVNKEEKMTSPPSRYTEATLLDAMDNAGRFVNDKSMAKTLKECEGIGTGATRDAIIKGLKERGYISLKGKTIYPTTKSMELFPAMPDSPLTSPIMTAELEQDLKSVESGLMTKGEFMNKVHEQVATFIDAVKKVKKQEVGGKSNSKTTETDNSKKVTGVCPICGGPIIENENRYYCDNWKSGCKTTIWKNALAKLGKPKVTKKEAQQLFNGKIIKVELVSKAGNKYSANANFNQSTNKIDISWK